MDEIFEIKPVSDEVKAAIKAKSALGLPDSPSDAGLGPEDIKKSMLAPVLDDNNEASAIGQLERVIAEANRILLKLNGGKLPLLSEDVKKALYTRLPNGGEGYTHYASEPTPGTIPVRGEDGTFEVSAPVQPQNPVTLAFLQEHAALSSEFEYADSYDLGEGCQVLSPACLVSGYENCVGAKKFYISAIKEISKATGSYDIYLSDAAEQPYGIFRLPAWNPSGSYYISDFPVDCSVAIGKAISVVNRSHYPFCAEVEDVDKNRLRVTFPHGIPFSKWDASAGVDVEDFTLWIPELPTLGLADVLVGTGVLGVKNLGSAAFGLVGGYGNVLGANYGLIGGRENKGGYAVLLGGYKNTVPGLYCIGGGENNVMWCSNGIFSGQNNVAYFSAAQAAIFGRNHTVGTPGVWELGSGYCAFVAGQYGKITGNTAAGIGYGVEVSATRGQGYGRGIKVTKEEQISAGRWNNPDSTARYTVGIGTSDSDRKNGLEVFDDGTVRLGAAPKNDMDAVTLGFLKETTGDIEAALDEIISLQEELMGGKLA